MPTGILPAESTPFIGRTKELADLNHVLADPACQLLTLVGAGGSGKTRLAVQLALHNAEAFPNGSYFIALAPLSSAQDIAPAIAHGLGLHLTADRTPEDQLLAFLRPKQLLIVLDNFEHLLAGTDLVANILAAAPATKLVVTSREALRLKEEWLRAIVGMHFPDRPTVEQIEGYSAVQLFAERARQVRGDFSLAAEQSPVITICRLVEGLPLGIELAAAWLRSLTCQQIAEAIQHNVDFLATPLRNVPERHRSMRAVFNESWNLLTVEEQAVYRKLAVFHGGFEQEAAERVASASLSTLTGLLDKSLLHVGASGRYDSHELLHQYAEEQLKTANEEEAARQAHLDYYANYLHHRQAQLQGVRQIEALNEIEVNFENVRATWLLAVRHRDYDAISRSLESLYLFCEMRGRLYEGQELFAQALERLAAGPGESPHPLWGRIVPRWAQLWRLNQGIPERAEEIKTFVETSLRLARTNGDRGEIAFCLWTLGTLAQTVSDWAEASAIFEESLAIFTELADRFNMARSADYVGSVNAQLDRAKHIRFAQQSLELRQSIGDKFGTALSLSEVVVSAFSEGRYVEAERLAPRVAAIFRETGGSTWASRTRAMQALIAVTKGDVERAKLMAQEVLETAPDAALSGAGLALIALGEVAIMDEDYVTARERCEQCLAAGLYNPVSGVALYHIQNLLALAACGLGEYQAARDHLRSTGHTAVPGAQVIVVLFSLPALAILHAHEGAPTQAVGLLALAYHHPAFANSWLPKWPLLIRLVEQLKAKVSPEVFSEIWEQRQANDPLEAVTSALRALRLDPGASVPVEARPMSGASGRYGSLLDPLSQRELEVLRLIADGLANAEIAAKLFLATGTIKAHTRSIYSKLDVNSRTQAVAQAQKLNLL